MANVFEQFFSPTGRASLLEEFPEEEEENVFGQFYRPTALPRVSRFGPPSPPSAEERVTALEEGEAHYRALAPRQRLAALERLEAELKRTPGPRAEREAQREAVERALSRRHAEKTRAVGEAVRKLPSRAVDVSLLFPGTWAATGALGMARLPRLGVWARPVAEAALGGGAEALREYTHGAAPADIARRSLAVGGAIGAIPGAGPALRQARAGWRTIGGAARPVTEPAARVLEPLARAGRALARTPPARGLTREAVSRALRGAGPAEVERERERAAAMFERASIITETADVETQLARDALALRARQGLEKQKEAVGLQLEAYLDELRGVPAMERLPAVPRGYVRLYRVQVSPGQPVPAAPWIADQMPAEQKAAFGRWFTDDPALLDWYRRDAPGARQTVYVDLPASTAERFRVRNLSEADPARAFSRDPAKEFFISPELGRLSQEIPAVQLSRSEVRELRRMFAEDADKLLTRSKDVPASEMFKVYEEARQSATTRFQKLMKARRALTREERQLLVRRTVMGERAPGLRATRERTRRALERAEEAMEAARGPAEAVAEEEALVQATREADAGLLSVLRRMSARTIPPHGYAMPVRRAKSGAWQTAGRTVPYYDLAQMEGIAAEAGYADVAAFRERLGDLVKASRKATTYRLGGRGGGTVKDWGELELGLTASEARAALDTLRQEMALTREGAARAATQWAGMSAADRTAALRKAGFPSAEAAARAEWKGLSPKAQEAFRRGIRPARVRRPPEPEEFTAYREAEAGAERAGVSFRDAEIQARRPEEAIAQHQRIQEQMRAVNQELRSLAWASPRVSKAGRARVFPPEAKEVAELTKGEAVERVWAEAEQKGWHPRAVRMLRQVSDDIGEAEDLLGRELVETGLLSAESAERWRGVHLRRVVPFYRGASLEDMIRWLEQHKPEDLPHLAQLEARKRQAERLRGLGRAPTRIPSAIWQPRRILEPELPEYLGAQRVPFLERHAAGTMLAARSAAEARALRQLAREFSVSPETYMQLVRDSPQVARRYIRLEQTRSLGELSGRYVERPVYNLLTNWQHLPSQGERLMALWKTFKVPLSPAASMHNLFCNKLMGAIEYGVGPFLPGNYRTTLRELHRGEGLWAQGRDLYPLGAGLWARSEVAAALGDYYAAGTLPKLYQAFIRGTLRKGTAAYGAMELLDKWACARWDHLVRGTPLVEAMRKADYTLINYARQPSWIIRARRGLFGLPFMTYPYNIARNLLPHWAKRHPGKLWAMYRAPGIISAIPAQRDEDQLRRVELEKALMPEWYAPDMMIRLPWPDRDGAALWFDLARFLPFSDVIEASYTSFREALEDLRRGGVGPELVNVLDVPVSLVAPTWQTFADLTAIAGGQRPGRYGYRELEEGGAPGKLKTAAIYVARTVLPGAVYDAIAAATAKGPTERQPWARHRVLETIRALGFPIVRVRPDLDYDRAVDRLDGLISRAALAEQEASPRWQGYWRRIQESAEKRLETLMEYPAPEYGDFGELPYDWEEEQE